MNRALSEAQEFYARKHARKEHRRLRLEEEELKQAERAFLYKFIGVCLAILVIMCATMPDVIFAPEVLV